MDTFDPVKRDAEKAASRLADERILASGKKRGWYSVLQYFPRLDQEGSVDVGLLLFAPGAPPFLDLQIGEAAKLGQYAFDARLCIAIRGLRRRLFDQIDAITSVEDLRRVLRQEGNNLQFSPVQETAPDQNGIFSGSPKIKISLY